MYIIGRRTVLMATVSLVGLIALPMASFAVEPVESTSLMERVESGELPPIEERLPANPLVLEPLERIGQQGGDWNHALVGGGSLSMLVRYQGYEPLFRFDPDWTGVIPNVAESYEVNEDATEYTIHLREGLRWSDGHPFTTADIDFWRNNVMGDENVTPGIQPFWQSGGEVGEVEIVDDYTFKVHFAGSNGFFIQQLAWAQQDQMTRTPKHYLEQFHLDFNPDANDLAQERGFESWIALFQNESGLVQDNTFFQNSNRPTLNAWAFEVAPGEDTERALAVRNPYYFKIDPEGTQLPYFDRVVYSMVADPEVLLFQVLQGQIDLMDQYIGTTANRPVLFDGQEQGDYSFYTLIESAANTMVYQLNLNHTDPVKNELFNNRDFRQAMSVAVDRQALIDTVFLGQGSPQQPSILESDPLYNERLATQHTEYDPDLANEILDGILPEKDSEGFRLLPNGERLSIIFEIDQTRTTFLDMMELSIPMFQAVGLDVDMRTMDRSLWETRVRHGREFDGTAHQFGANSGIAAMLDARYFVPFNSNALYAPGWNLYFTEPDNESAIEPPADILAQQELYRELLSTGDEQGQNEIMAEILENAADQFLVFGVSMPPDSFGIVKNDMVNVPDTMPNSFGWPTPAPARPETFFKE
jgi:peptide/nickel transport system substrate-binding protein